LASGPRRKTEPPTSILSWRHSNQIQEKTNDYSSQGEASRGYIPGGDSYRRAGANGQHDLPVQQRDEPK
jgi:hypothetical protein